MKIWPAAVLHPAISDAAIECALQICRFTHNNVLAMSGAAAMAAATSEGVKIADQCRQHYCRRCLRRSKGYLLAQEQGAMMVAGPSVARRIELAVEIGKRHRHWETAVVEIADIIGSGCT